VPRTDRPDTERALILRAPPSHTLSRKGSTMSPAPQSALSASTAQAGRRRRTGKAALAGVVAVGLLAAGGGTFSKWYDEEAIASDTLSSGELSLDALSSSAWTDLSDNAEIDPASFRLVPGDTVRYTAVTTVHAQGDNLAGVMTVEHPDLPAGADAALRLGHVHYDVQIEGLADKDSDGDGRYEVTPADDGKPVTVTATIDWPAEPTEGLEGQNESVDLTGTKHVLEQAVQPRA